MPVFTLFYLVSLTTMLTLVLKGLLLLLCIPQNDQAPQRPAERHARVYAAMCKTLCRRSFVWTFQQRHGAKPQ